MPRNPAAIRKWSPWKSSTGPRSAAGKARAAQNAAKPWKRLDPDHVFKQALRDHGRYLIEIHRYIALEKIAAQNELLKRLPVFPSPEGREEAKRWRRRAQIKRLLKTRRAVLEKQGREVTLALAAALTYAKLCKNLAFSPPLAVKVNANDDTKP